MMGRTLRRPSELVRHVSALTSYATETIECSCGAVVRGSRDEAMPDRHRPLIAAWEEHRRAAGSRRVAGL